MQEDGRPGCRRDLVISAGDAQPKSVVPRRTSLILFCIYAFLCFFEIHLPTPHSSVRRPVAHISVRGKCSLSSVSKVTINDHPWTTRHSPLLSLLLLFTLQSSYCMPQPTPAPATDRRKAVCLCCRKRLHPTTVWRHAQVAATADALNEVGSSRIPPSYPRASFVLGSRRLARPSSVDVSGLAQSMEAAHLSEDGKS